MGLKLPKNQFVTNYTSGGEYIVEKTYQNYQGYYYEYNNKAYAGKFFSIKSPRLIKKGSDEVNKLLLDPATAQYAAISGVKLNKDEFKHHYFIPSEEELKKREAIRYFAKKTNTNPIIIREVNKESYDSLSNNPLYTTIKLRNYLNQDALDTGNFYTFIPDDVYQAEKTMTGITAFLNI
jgi:hypothetical protein